MAMTKVVSIKVPDDMAILQSRLTATAKRAQMPVWELMSRMLDSWDEAGNGAPSGNGWAEWRPVIEEKVQALQAEIEAIKAQAGNGLLVDQTIQSELSGNPPEESLLVDQGELQEQPSEVDLLVDQVNQTPEAEAVPKRRGRRTVSAHAPEAEAVSEPAKPKQGRPRKKTR
jgi:hypothetical protein